MSALNKTAGMTRSGMHSLSLRFLGMLSARRSEEERRAGTIEIDPDRFRTQLESYRKSLEAAVDNGSH